jgi:hypothetical protein
MKTLMPAWISNPAHCAGAYLARLAPQTDEVYRVEEMAGPNRGNEWRAV